MASRKKLVRKTKQVRQREIVGCNWGQGGGCPAGDDPAEVEPPFV